MYLIVALVARCNFFCGHSQNANKGVLMLKLYLGCREPFQTVFHRWKITWDSQGLHCSWKSGTAQNTGHCLEMSNGGLQSNQQRKLIHQMNSENIFSSKKLHYFIFVIEPISATTVLVVMFRPPMLLALAALDGTVTVLQAYSIWCYNCGAVADLPFALSTTATFDQWKTVWMTRRPVWHAEKQMSSRCYQDGFNHVLTITTVS